MMLQFVRSLTVAPFPAPSVLPQLLLAPLPPHLRLRARPLGHPLPPSRAVPGAGDGGRGSSAHAVGPGRVDLSLPLRAGRAALVRAGGIALAKPPAVPRAAA